MELTCASVSSDLPICILSYGCTYREERKVSLCFGCSSHIEGRAPFWAFRTRKLASVCKAQSQQLCRLRTRPEAAMPVRRRVGRQEMRLPHATHELARDGQQHVR